MPKHAPGETGPVCGKTDFRFPHDFALTTDQRVTCPACLAVLRRKEDEVSDQDKVVANLYGGPSNGVKLWIEPDPRWSSPWAGYICLNMKQGMPMHYTLVSAGVYEFAGACAEFDHDPEEHQQRCPDCGAKILPGSDRHPGHGR